MSSECNDSDVKDIAHQDDVSVDKTKKDEQKVPNEADYELIDGVYHYTDKKTGVQYMYDSSKNDWVEQTSASSTHSNSEVTTDSEGRQYYWANEMYICKDSQGYTYYMDDKNEWQPWSDSSVNESKSSSNIWYFHKSNGTFYRDNSLNKVYKLNKETNEWEEYKKRKRKKEPKSGIEEFDTDEEEDMSSDEEEEDADNNVPPGFPSDQSIVFDGNVYTKHDASDNMKYEWDPLRKAWFPLLDDDFMATYQLSYGFNPDGTKNENPLKFDDDDEPESQKMEEELQKKKEKEKPKQGWFNVDDAHNSKVYVSNLPSDITEESFVEFMSKCGLVHKDPESQNFKIKMYYDSEGNFKGDALCTYIKIESVDLALQILDGYKLKNNVVKVERAKFTLKGEYNPSLKPKKKRKKVLEKLQKKQEKLLDWHPDPLRGQRKKHENVVIFKNVFSPSEFDGVAERIFTHKDAIKKQAETFGAVKKVELFDRNEEGVVKVTFNDADSADMCVATLNKRLYLKKTLDVQTWDGVTKYVVEESEEEREKRLKNWGKFIEGK